MTRGVVDSVRDTVLAAVDDTRVYLASPQGRRMRRRVAAGLMVAAPVVARMPFMKAGRLGRFVGMAGGAALIVKAAELLRDWEPVPEARTTP